MLLHGFSGLDVHDAPPARAIAALHEVLVVAWKELDGSKACSREGDVILSSDITRIEERGNEDGRRESAEVSAFDPVDVESQEAGLWNAREELCLFAGADLQLPSEPDAYAGDPGAKVVDP